MARDAWQPVQIRDLEPSAWRAVRSESNTAIVAGPGAGKTELLAQRASFLFQTNSCMEPRRILAISFKRDSATNLDARVAERNHYSDASRFDSMTFDSFAKHLLDRFRSALPEQWRPTADYEISFFNSRAYENFLNGLQGPLELGGSSAMFGIARRDFERDHVLGTRLPCIQDTPRSMAEWAALSWWNSCLRQAQSQLSFPMIGRLAELLLRVNPKLRKALPLCYSHVFLDEFQDTTQVQYDLTFTAFHGTSTSLTAVGDDKQSIMRWALAMADSFGAFQHDFGAERLDLIFNYRSSPELVRIQHILARAIFPDVTETESRATATVEDDCCRIFSFPNRTSEARYIAAHIAAALQRDMKPRDFVILARQKTIDYASELTRAFAEQGLEIRNEDLEVGGVKLQDLLAEGFVRIASRLLRVASADRAGSAWADSCHDLEMLGLGTGFGENRTVEVQLDGYSTLFRARWTDPASVNDVVQVVESIVRFLGRDRLSYCIPTYRDADWLNQVITAFGSLLQASLAGCQTWSEAMDNLDGTHTTPLMTIHKSKGLEYHTVILIGFDDTAWWSFRREPADGYSAFFVAFSRAMQQVIFTYCRTEPRTLVQPLCALLAQAGVREELL